MGKIVRGLIKVVDGNVKHLDRWIYRRLRDRVVTGVEWGEQACIELEQDGRITVGLGAFYQQGPIWLPPDPRMSLADQGEAELRPLIGSRVLSAVGFHSGGLRVVFDNGRVLTVRANGPYVPASMAIDKSTTWQRPDVEEYEQASVPTPRHIDMRDLNDEEEEEEEARDDYDPVTNEVYNDDGEGVANLSDEDPEGYIGEVIEYLRHWRLPFRNCVVTNVEWGDRVVFELDSRGRLSVGEEALFRNVTPDLIFDEPELRLGQQGETVAKSLVGKKVLVSNVAKNGSICFLFDGPWSLVDDMDESPFVPVSITWDGEPMWERPPESE